MACILVIHEDLFLSHTIHEILRFKGYDVITTATISQGLQMAQTSHPDLMVCNAQLLDENDLNLIGIFPIPRILIVLGRHSVDWDKWNVSRTADQIVKPIRFSKLVVTIQEMLALN